MYRIYRLKDRLDFLGIKCEYCIVDGIVNTTMFRDAVFRDSKRPEAPTAPVPPAELPNAKYDAELLDYNERMVKFAARMAQLDALSPRPNEDTVLAVREQIGIFNDMADIIRDLVLDPDCDFLEDDYYATVWRDARPYPTIEVVRAQASLTRENKSLDRNRRLKAQLVYEESKKLLSGSGLSRAALELLAEIPGLAKTPAHNRLAAITNFCKAKKADVMAMSKVQLDTFDHTKGWPV